MRRIVLNILSAEGIPHHMRGNTWELMPPGKFFVMRFTMMCFPILTLFLSISAFPVLAAEKTHINSIGMEFVLIPAGSFMMGSPDNYKYADSDEKPQHKVTISKSFYLGTYEVTQAQWEAVMGSNPSLFKGRSNPVENVPWEDAQEFIKRLNAKEGHSRYRLPTEAEWEYAARAGSTGVYCFGDDADQLGGYAWYKDNSGKATHPVGQKQSNAWGLYDMHGNVWEWVEDWYDDEYYSRSPGTDPKGPSSGSYRALRGGGCLLRAWYCRSAYRNSPTPGYRHDFIGFRLVLSPE
jgi:formylglycine-generating enzyme required for sulfatase activity